MTAKKVVLVLLALVAIGQAGYLTWAHLNRPGPDDEEVPAEFVCVAPECGAGFTMTRSQLVEAQKAGEGVPCTTCGKALTKRAMRCPSCQKMLALVGHGATPSKCTSCGKQIRVDDKGVPFCPGG
jgi:predicted RNA-binding Zn-ribbon protein involved in translation (DUF1610 family)